MNEVRSTGPYVITTTKQVPPGPSTGRAETLILSRRAAATLGEARAELRDAADDHRAGVTPDSFKRIDSAINNLPEQGGTVGPLPDGAVIEVVAVGWIELSRGIPASHRPERTIPTAEDRNEPGLTTGLVAREALLAAYNEAQET